MAPFLDAAHNWMERWWDCIFGLLQNADFWKSLEIICIPVSFGDNTYTHFENGSTPEILTCSSNFMAVMDIKIQGVFCFKIQDYKSDPNKRSLQWG